MSGQAYIPAQSALREAAGRNLAAFLGAMLDKALAAGIPAIVCTTASNESGLAPLGGDDVAGLDEAQRSEVRSCLAEEPGLSGLSPCLFSVPVFQLAIGFG